MDTNDPCLYFSEQPKGGGRTYPVRVSNACIASLSGWNACVYNVCKLAWERSQHFHNRGTILSSYSYSVRNLFRDLIVSNN